MTVYCVRVRSTTALHTALQDPRVRAVRVVGELSGVRRLRLWPGQRLSGEPGAQLRFAPGQDGVQVTRDNAVQRLELHTDTGRRVVFNDTTVRGLGRLRLAEMVVTGQVLLVAADRVTAGDVLVDGLAITTADLAQCPSSGPESSAAVHPGAFTLWNRHVHRDVAITARLVNISAGKARTPVRGSAIVVGADRAPGFRATQRGGRVEVSLLDTGEIHVDGTGSPGSVAAAVYLCGAARLRTVRHRGPVTTYGPHAPILENRCEVGRWTVEADLTSYGAYSPAILNDGTVRHLRVDAMIESFGLGAPGFRQRGGYTGTALFDRIVTHGAGAVGVDLGGRLDTVVLARGVDTFGGSENGMPAHAVRISSDAVIGTARVRQGLTTAGDDVAALTVQGEVGALDVSAGVHATGQRAPAIVVAGGRLPLQGVEATSLHGVAVVLDGATLTALGRLTARGATGDVMVARDSTVVSTTAAPVDAAGIAARISGPGRLRWTAARERHHGDV